MPTTIDGKPIDWQWIANHMHSPMYVFDGHNILDHRLAKLGFCIDGIGRPVILPGEDVVFKVREEPAAQLDGADVADISAPIQTEVTTPIAPLISV